METTEQLNKAYADLLAQQHFVESELDYTIPEKHKAQLQQLAQLGNSGVTVFDLYRKQHLFWSYNMEMLFGYDPELMEQKGNDYINSRIHPDDYMTLTRNGIFLLNFVFALPLSERMDYKLINEYRILNQAGHYMRVIEQHQPLELDPRGNIWLAMSMMDVAPDQDEYRGVRYQLLNYKTGRFVLPYSGAVSPDMPLTLTKREQEILFLIRDGLLSKEISEKLFISVHTVNTHRQHILEKLGASNSIEAVHYASQLGLLQ
ncbi:LuxR C-terminal-related transcriptional regulator [Microbacter margulisiae]|uniref:DNA-binding CsgD family transcriptional regulator n=1 Tax=Microbacter margulisiae TaxID=1350067 RepID=A0A7W5DP84_9PORP|nr:LuxR C-terminal-related transcriptional regulator [Microbacter margulisiae]MBB3186255.1 DNA-binding CsgD family transcriptional regulator [Microbacter margulisiae]